MDAKVTAFATPELEASRGTSLSCYSEITFVMKVFEKREFRSFYDRDSGAIFSDLEFRKCRFVSCAISITMDPTKRSTVRNVRLIGCEYASGSLWPAIVEEVVVDGLKTSQIFQSWGAVFKHVSLCGRIGRVMFSSVVAPGSATKAQQQAFDQANAEFYSDVDWALDLRNGEFTECEIQGVPACLIRRDPETQVIVTRAKAVQGEWRRLDLSKTHWHVSLQLLLNRGDQDAVLVAPKRSPKFSELLAGLKLLREAGVAEAD